MGLAKGARWKAFYRDEYPKRWVKSVEEYGSTPYHELLLDLMEVRPGQAVLECGIGTGWPLGVAVAERGGRLYGIDIAAPLLERCRSTFAERALPVTCARGDIESLPFADEAFDLVYAFSTTWYIPNIERGLGEMARVTKQGGRLIFDAINAWHPSQALVYGYHNALMALSYTKRKLDGRPTDQCFVPSAARTPLRLRKVLRRLGLRYRVKGFYVLLPLSLPVIGRRGDLCRFSPLFSYRLQDSPVLRHLGAKLLYVCEKG